MSGYSIIEDIYEFVTELIASLNNGYLFFGSLVDIIRYIMDIVIVSFLFYSVLVFLRQTRAWQLIKGIAFIFLFVFFCNIIGLEMVGYVFNKLLYVLAILLIVIFQPEIRRAIETVGLRSGRSIKKSISNTKENADSEELQNFIHVICEACSDMAETYTGALIIIERRTKLDELLTQENAVKIDFNITKETIESIFYKGAPMHDGAVLVRDGRMIGARCHIPLSVNMHKMDRTGTRHRAAVGASEMGDTVAVVVSEERGKVSIAVSGKLYEMADENELEANLSYLFGLKKTEEQNGFFSRIFKRKSKDENKEAEVLAVQNAEVKSPYSDDFVNPRELRKAGFGSKLVFMIISILASIFLWMYIQVTTNPVVTTTMTVPISYSAEYEPTGVSVAYPIENVEIEVVGRKDTISELTSDDISVYLDYSQVNGAGVYELPLEVKSNDDGVYFRVQQKLPETISVTVYGSNDTASQS